MAQPVPVASAPPLQGGQGPNGLRQPGPIPAQAHPHTNALPIIPFTFHTARHFIRVINGVLFIGQYCLKPTTIIKIVCRCVAKYTPYAQPGQPAPIGQTLIFQDLTSSWTCGDQTISSWANVGDIVELYCTITPPQPQQVEPILYPISIKVITDNDDDILKQCQKSLTTLDLTSSSTTPSPTNSNPLYLKSHPSSYFIKFQSHLDECRIWYMNHGYTKEYINHITKRKLPHMLELENPYYIIPLNQHGYDNNRFVLDHATRRVLYQNTLDVTDRLVSRVLHVKSITQCPHAQSQYCTPECQQCILDDNSTQQPAITTSAELAPSIESLANASIIPAPKGLESIHKPKMQNNYMDTGVSSGPIPTALPPPGSGMAYPPMGGYPGTGTGGYPTTGIGGYPSTGGGYPAPFTTQAPVSTGPSPTQTTSHFDIYRYTYIPAPRQGETIMLYSFISFPVQQNVPQGGVLTVQKTDTMYNILSRGYCDAAMQDHFKMYQYYIQTLPKLYADLTGHNYIAAYGSWFNYIGERHTVKDGIYKLYPDDPKLFIVDQSISKTFLHNHKDKYLNVTLDQLNFATPFGKKQYKDWIDANPNTIGSQQLKPLDIPDWCIRTKNFTSAPLSTPNTIVTTTGYIACHANSEFVNGFQLYDGSQYPLEFAAGRNYPYPNTINYEIRFQSNRTINPPKILPTQLTDINPNQSGITTQAQRGLQQVQQNTVAKFQQGTDKQKNQMINAAALEVHKHAAGTVTSTQNNAMPFTLSSGFTHQAIIKLYIQCQIDTTNTNPQFKDQVFHFNIVAYELIPCTSFQQRDQIILDNQTRAKSDDLVIVESTLAKFPDQSFAQHLRTNPSFLYNPELTTPVQFTQLSITKNLEYVAPRNGYFLGDPRTLCKGKLQPNRIYRSTAMMRNMSLKYDYQKSQHTNIIKSVDLADSTFDLFGIEEGCEIFGMEVGSKEWPAAMQRNSVVEWYFCMYPDSVDKHIKFALVGYKILRLSPNDNDAANAKTFFDNIKNIADKTHLVFWDEAVARNVTRTLCPDFQSPNPDDSAIPMLF